MSKKQIVMRCLKFLGNILAVFSILFVAYRLYEMDFEWDGFENHFQTYLFLFLLSFLAIFNNFINAFAWKKYIDFFSGEKNNVFVLSGIYLKANIQKYLPGNVVQYAGRNLLAKEYGISQKSIAAASVMELIWISVSAVFFSVVISLQNTKIVIRQLWSHQIVKENIKIFLALSVIILFIGFVVLKTSKDKKMIVSYLNRTFFILLGVTGLIYISNFIISGLLLFLILVLILHCEVSYISIASTNVLAWLAGYIVPGSPGGIGIRETVLILLLGTEHSRGTVTLAAVLLRVCGIAGDFFSYLMVLCVEFFKTKRKTRYVS